MDYNTDPWDPEARRMESATDAPDLDVRVVPDVEPIALADATRTQACVPVALQDAIFGTRTPARFSFAVIDGAKIDGLAELLETSGLPHRCLYTKDSGLQDVAPWLVELHDGTPFVRSLFTVGDAPWALWGRGWGTVLRSAMPLDALYAHLRHFTQVRLDGPKHVFFRFWEPRVMARYLFNHHDTARENLLALMGEGEIICVDWWNDIAVHAQARVAAERPRHWPHLREDLDRIRLQIYCETLTDELGERVPPLGDIEKSERLETVTDLVMAARQMGWRSEKSVERYCLAAILLGTLPQQDPRFDKVLNSDKHELDRSRLTLKLAIDLTGESG